MTPDGRLRAVLDSVFTAPAYHWSKHPDPWQWVRDWLYRIVDWLLALRTEHPASFKLVLAAAGIVFVAILVHAGCILWRTIGRATGADASTHETAQADARDAEWHFRQADAAAAAGRYREALRLVFAGVVLRLDALGTVHRTAGKTPAEYAREARLAGEDRARLGELVSALYRHLYAGVPCGPEDYARWRGSARGSWHAAAG